MRRGRGLRDAIWWMLRILNLSLLFLIASAVGLVLGTYSGIAELIPNARDLGDIRPGQASRVLSAEGELLATVATEHRQFVQLEQIPQALQHGAGLTRGRSCGRRCTTSLRSGRARAGAR
jgi:membrane carboxypeptidase/penicillin-binding protein